MSISTSYDETKNVNTALLLHTKASLTCTICTIYTLVTDVSPEGFCVAYMSH